MAKNNKPIIILNLTGQLFPELGDYFAKKALTVIDPLESSVDGQEWTHIITKDVADFTLIADTYNTISQDIKVISLSGVEDIQNFILANGKLILCEVWMKSPLGEFILDKFFQEYGGISLSESYPAFLERGSFNITNPFNTGEYLDRLVHSAFIDGISALAVKTFFDHSVMYLTSLKKSGKIGLPIEVHYGYFNDVFGVQLHFFTQGLELEDVTFSLSNEINRRSDNYLLNVAVHSSDFFDFSLLKEVNKTIITALWTKDERIKNENRGLLLSELSASAKLTEYPSEGVTSFQTTNHELADITDSVTISGSEERDDFLHVVKGSASDKPFSQIVKGSKQEKDNFRTFFKQNETGSNTVYKENEKILNLKISTLSVENDGLKAKIKTLMSEVKILKDSKTHLAEMNEKARQAVAAAAAASFQSNQEADTAIKEQFLQKLKDQQILSENEAKKLATIIERENKFVAEAKDLDLKLRKAQIEATQKESFFAQEVEKFQRQLNAKEMVVTKIKETLSKLVEQKDNELRATEAKLDQATKALASSPSQSQANQIRELQRQVLNHEKMIEIYKKQIQKPVEISEEDNSKDENKRLTMLNNQMKNQLEMAKKEITKYQERTTQDSSLLNSLKAEKGKLEQMLKKIMMEAKKEEHTNNNQQFEIEIKKLSTQVEFLDKQLKESHLKTRDLEHKLADSLKNQKKDVITDQESRGKTAHLENNVRKLTQDLVESRNQLAEMKKESNKLRQEKTALQNQMDKMKKESDKNKPAVPKKPGAGGKAA